MTAVEEYRPGRDPAPLEGILVPGWVNAHCHLELSHLHGAIAPGGGFAAFAAAMGRTRGLYTEQQRLQAAERADRAMWEEGVQAVGDVCNGESTFTLKSRSPIRYHSFMELFGLRSADAAAQRDSVRRAEAMGLRASVTPHSLYSLNTAAFADAAGDELRTAAPEDSRSSHRAPNGAPCAGKTFGAGGTTSADKTFGADTAERLRPAGKHLPAAGPAECAPLSIHFLESEGEAALFRGEGDLSEWYARAGFTTDFLGFGSPAARLTAQVPASRQVLLVHGCCAGEAEMERIDAHFTRPVTWVVCPRSNRYISGARPPLELLLRRGAQVAVGTDSLASNTSLSMVAELAAMPEVPLEERLWWATGGGAQALGLAHRIGAFETGLSPGAVLLTGADIRSPRPQLTPEARSRRLI